MKAVLLFIVGLFFSAAALAAGPIAKKDERYVTPGYTWTKLNASKKECLVAQGAPVTVLWADSKVVLVKYDGSLREQPYCRKGSKYPVKAVGFRRYTKIM